MTHGVTNLNQRLHDQAVDEFNRLHGTMIGEISAMLKTAKVAPLVDLRKNNPTFTSVVEELRFYRNVCAQLVPHFSVDKTSEIKMIDEYLELADDLAQAIEADNPEALCAAIAALDVKPYI
ncbi:hypothetical protein LZ641_17090 [Hafnia paralvei]|uniref:hypothetical protein n=1 Tax=Hafnia paralvei TaxID=546367 RepID=UPI001F4912A8|nr:hypothetical protein [Hafnia paralvei]MCE9882032.1 hypothetical protein [Hafnia paralvei]MCE9909102.1 hypothetical protein [Hafnia paralvei]MCE9912902.1 hypothetical protein [Hafnia paralvei]